MTVQHTQQIIPAKDALWGHKWGFADTHLQIDNDRSVMMVGDRYPLSGYKMPYLLPYIEALLGIKIEHDICLIPFGGAANVSCALQTPHDETRMIVSVDMKRMNQIEWIDPDNLRACVQAGMTGQQLEEALEKEGFMCGHEPDSLELSTLGGWISTHASGMKRNRYGNIEQIVENIVMITPQGVLEQVEAVPRAAMGMQLQKLLFGSEGNLGLITKAVIKIHPIPPVKKYDSLVFPNFELGVTFLYELAHSGFAPASIRLVDNNQFHFGQSHLCLSQAISRFGCR